MQHVLPDRFAQVVAGVYRSSFPDTLHLNVYEATGIKTILSLSQANIHQLPLNIFRRSVTDDYVSPHKGFFEKKIIRCLLIPAIPSKEGGTKTTDETVNKIMNTLLNQYNYPILIHCNQGKVRYHFAITLISFISNISH